MSTFEKKPLHERATMPIKEMKMVGRSFFVQIEIGNKTRVVEISMKQFNEMLDELCEGDDVPFPVLDRMAKICRKNFTKGRVSRRLRDDTIQMLKEGYAAFFGHDWASIMSHSRKAAYIETRRHIYGHLKALGYTELEMAARFINRDRTTIYSGIEMHNALMETDEDYELVAISLGKHMDEWMMGNLPKPTEIPMDAYIEKEDSIHVSTDRARIDRDSTAAAEAVGKAMKESGW